MSLLASMAMVYLLGVVANIVVAPLELPYRLVLVIKKLPCRLVLARLFLISFVIKKLRRGAVDSFSSSSCRVANSLLAIIVML